MNAEEKNLWQLFKKHLPIGCDHQRIETGSTGRGIPDVNLCYHSKELWVELKIVKGLQIDLQPEQVSWHHRRIRAGGTTWILARDKFDGPRKGKGDFLYLWHGSKVVQAKEHGITDDSYFKKWPTNKNWPSVIQTIFHGVMQ